MELPLYQIDAFTDRPFAGNPAAVCPLDAWLPDATLQAIANENNLSETAFVVPTGPNRWHLRWFTPTVEVTLCGHATLASAWLLLCHLGAASGEARFDTLSGELIVRQIPGGALTMDFPALPPRPLTEPPPEVAAALVAGGGAPTGWYAIRSVHEARYFMATFQTADQVRALTPDTAAMGRAHANVIATAPGAGEPGGLDFVSRFFAPASGVPEDPVTGSAHCTLAPYWAGVLGKERLQARQISRRGGDVGCEVAGERVLLTGACALYLEGRISLG